MKTTSFIISFVFIAWLVIMITGCGNSEEKETQNTPNQQETAEQVVVDHSDNEINTRSAGAGTKKSTPVDENVTILGSFEYRPAQRMTIDSGLDALTTDQVIGGLGFAFEFQREDIIEQSQQNPMQSMNSAPSADHETPFSGQLICITGKFITESITTFSYNENPNGGKPTSGEHGEDMLTYFLAEDDFKAYDPIQCTQRAGTITVPIDARCLEQNVSNVTVRFVNMSDEDLVEPVTLTLKAGELNTIELIADGPLDTSDAILQVTNIDTMRRGSVIGTQLPPVAVIIYQRWPFGM